MISENEYSGGGAPDSGNAFNVRSNDGGETIWFDRCGHTILIHRREALLFAAWLVCIAGGDRRDFEQILRAIRKS